VFQRWRDAGAKRYLLRIETSDRELYSRIHPSSCDFLRRQNCLRILRDLDYQVGTGVMIGLPGQTFDMLARDIAFFGETDVDMIGMGPYIPHPDTPLKGAWDSEKAYRLGLKMIALTRLYLHDVNIAATTALQALSPRGREEGLLYGANVMMPNITPLKYRENYKLYADKPQTDENSAESREALSEAIRSIGERINYHSEGNSPHYLARHS
jgi:biotin synthase